MKKLIRLGVITFMLLFSCTVYASNIPLGTLSKSNVTLDVNNAKIEMYKVFETNYVAVSKLKSAGFNVTFTSKYEPVHITFTPSKNAASPKTLADNELKGKSFTLYSGDVYVGHLKTQAITSNGKVLIPAAALNQIFNSNLTNNTYVLTPKTEAPVVATQTSIKNYSDQTIDISVNDLYWDNGIIQKTLYFTLAPEQILEREPSSDKKYLTTIVATATYPGFCYKNTSLCGQNNETLLRLNDFSSTLSTTDFGDKTDLATLYWADKTINEQKLTSSTKYLVWTNLEKQKTFVFTMENGRWNLLKHFVCSSGKPSTPTPTGTYKLTKKVASFGQDHGYCCKNAFGFIGTSYLYHSILFDKTGSYLLEGRGVLGTKASDGCIRLSPENSKWFYDHLISGTTVWIN